MGLPFGIVGCGDIAEKSFAPSLVKSDLTELTAVCRRDLKLARRFAEKFGNPAAYGSAEEVIRHPDVKAVILATPPNVHREETLLASENGKHVLCEKPMAVDAGECREMIQACKEAGVKLGVAYRRRVFPQVVKAKELIAAGAIGKVVCVRTHFSGLCRMEESWRTERSVSGGGMMMDMAVHRLEVLLNFAGRPLDVQALVETVHHDWPVDDSCAILLRFEDGKIGVHSTIGTSPPRRDFAQIDGTEGRILIDPLEFGVDHVNLERPGGIERTPVTPLKNPYFDLPMIEDFVQAVSADREPICDGVAGYWTQAVVDASYLSAEKGTRETIVPF